MTGADADIPGQRSEGGRGRDWNYHGYHGHTADAAINNDTSEPHVNNNFPAQRRKTKTSFIVMETVGKGVEQINSRNAHPCIKDMGPIDSDGLDINKETSCLRWLPTMCLVFSRLVLMMDSHISECQNPSAARCSVGVA